MEPISTSTLKDMSFPESLTALFAESVAIMARLRGPGGCPWDQEQSFDTIRKHTLEEAYEVLDAIDRRDWSHLTEELGDLLLQVLFYAQMGSEIPVGQGRFTMGDILETLNRKLIRRHPHVFGEEASVAAGNQAEVNSQVDGSAAKVLANWEQIKEAERTAVRAEHQSKGIQVTAPSSLDSVLITQPALSQAAKLGSKAAKVGFDWPHWRDLLAKVEEETKELIFAVEAPHDLQNRQELIESEVGDLLFTVVNLGRHLGVDPEMALRGTNARFRRRFRLMEEAAVSGPPLVERSPADLESLWAAAKLKIAQTGYGAER